MQKVIRDAHTNKPFGVSWVASQPAAHPHWNDYLITLADLTTVVEGQPPHFFKEGMTHEVNVFAINPEHEGFDLTDAIIDGKLGSYVLYPQNHIYQFKAESDMLAHERIDKIAKDIHLGNINPDTDFRRFWNNLFSDGAKSPNR